MKSKEEAKKDFVEMIEKSWSYGRMTEEEKIKCDKVFSEDATERALKGNYDVRWHILQAIYTAYLVGIGYTGFYWREIK